jgi:hypothetical protein
MAALDGRRDLKGDGSEKACEHPGRLKARYPTTK